MPGHLFITRGDIRHLACEAWLLPTAADVHVRRLWFKDDKRLRAVIESGRHLDVRSSTPGWRGGDTRVALLLPATTPARDGGELACPAVWLANVGGHERTEASWLVEAVVDFVRAAGPDAAQRVDRDRRDRPLLAIPLVGTGHGGGARRKGEIARELVRQLEPVLEEIHVDVVLVTQNPEAFAAAQRARRMHWGHRWEARWRDAFAETSEETSPGDPIKTGMALAKQARRGRLVLFVGAGVSAGAGLPQWTTLLEQLAANLDLPVEEMKSLGALDRATVIATALEREHRSVGDAVAAQIPDGPYSLAHSLIATLPVTEVITTNYDRRLEDAAVDCGRPFTVLDSAPLAAADRWLLKLHGSVTKPDDIVLTREDYLGYGQRRAALRGIVQAMLITRHMLFVGFGMSDDNFHAIAHDVRQALRSGERNQPMDPFGTALLVRERALFDKLWKGDIAALALAPEASDVGVGARRVDLLLDFVLAEAESALTYFMDPAFTDLLSLEERGLRSALADLGQLPDDTSPVWLALSDFLKRLGRPGAD